MLLSATLIAAGVAMVIVITGHLATAIVDQGWPRYRLRDAPGIIARVVAHPDDPGRAWDPVNTGEAPPGPVAWWLVFAAVTATPAALAATAIARRRRPTYSASWATPRQLRKLRVRGDDHGRLVVGTDACRRFAVEARHSLLVLGPTQTGKTTGLAIPAILEWPGPVVATSVKSDLIADTIGWRSSHGEVSVFDPAACTPFVRSHWTPLAECGTWSGSMRAAWELTTAAKAAHGSTMSVGDFWYWAAAKALAPLLLAAHQSGRTIADVARWVDREERDEPLALLRALEPDAAIAHEATFRREERGRSNLVQVLQSSVGPYLDPTVMETARRCDIVPSELLDGGRHTLYLSALPDEQDRLRPLFTALLGQVISAAYRQAGRSGRPLDPPLLLVLDEAANIAPVENLPTVAATAASMGVQLVTIFQDLAQVNLRYGQAAGTVVNNHRAKLFLPAVSDLGTLDLASRLVGDEELDRASHTTDATGRRSETTATQWRRLLPPELANRLGDGEAVLLYGNLPPARLRLRPWYRDRRLRRLAKHAQRPLTTEADPAPPARPTPTAHEPASTGTNNGSEVVSIFAAAKARRRQGGTP
ncbi:MAG TPA: type IV secretory system conjugative DNA transfer family protein [Acidimicrobiales bacterium]|nr:type IV secretory system conjugative DNA transfer family protein [Acidimicrobiales bacterium]